MANTKNERNRFITKSREAANTALQLKALLEAMQTDWNNMSSYLEDASGSDPDAQDYDGGDFTPGHDGLMVVDITAAYTTFEHILVAFALDHVTNLVNARKY